MLVTWFTWETVSLAGARSKTDGVLNCTSWPHVPTPAYMCMGSNHSLVGRSGPSVEMTCCLPGHRRGTDTGNTCSGQPTKPWSGWVLAGSACDCWLASSHTRSRCTHSCSWRTANQRQTCTQALHPCEQRGKTPMLPTCLGGQCGDRNVALKYCVYLFHHDRTLMAWPLIWYYLIALYMFIWVVTGQGPHQGHWALCCLRVMFITSIRVNLYIRPGIFVCAFL